MAIVKRLNGGYDWKDLGQTLNLCSQVLSDFNREESESG